MSHAPLDVDVLVEAIEYATWRLAPQPVTPL
jgi:hypothetical protein